MGPHQKPPWPRSRSMLKFATTFLLFCILPRGGLFFLSPEFLSLAGVGWKKRRREEQCSSSRRSTKRRSRHPCHPRRGVEWNHIPPPPLLLLSRCVPSWLTYIFPGEALDVRRLPSIHVGAIVKDIAKHEGRRMYPRCVCFTSFFRRFGT